MNGDFELSRDESFYSTAAVDKRDNYAEMIVVVVVVVAIVAGEIVSDFASRNRRAEGDRLVMCPDDAVLDNSNHLMD